MNLPALLAKSIKENYYFNQLRYAHYFLLLLFAKSEKSARDLQNAQ